MEVPFVTVLLVGLDRIGDLVSGRVMYSVQACSAAMNEGHVWFSVLPPPFT
jgi:hypothetical protein